MAKRTHKPPPRQIDEFRKAARELGCDENEERFQGALRVIAKQKPKETKSVSSHRRIRKPSA